MEGADRSSLARLALVSCGRSAATVTDRAEVCWLVAPEIDAHPAMWSLLDPQGAASRWLDASPVDDDECERERGPRVGPVVRTPVQIAGRPAEALDGLQRDGAPVRAFGMADLAKGRAITAAP